MIGLKKSGNFTQNIRSLKNDKMNESKILEMTIFIGFMPPKFLAIYMTLVCGGHIKHKENLYLEICRKNEKKKKKKKTGKVKGIFSGQKFGTQY